MNVAGSLAFLRAELGGEGKDGFAALFVLRGDVHNEGGANVGVGNGIKNFEGAVGFSGDGQLLQAGEETALVAKLGGVVVVRVASFPVGKDDGFGAKLSNDGGEAQFVSS